MSNLHDEQSFAPELLAFFAEIRAKGGTLSLRGPGTGRLFLAPHQLYSQLSDASILAWRKHLQEIKAIVRDNVYEPPPAPVPAPVAPEPPPEPEPPEPELPEHIRRIVEWNTPAEYERRRKEATAVMMLTMGLERTQV